MDMNNISDIVNHVNYFLSNTQQSTIKVIHSDNSDLRRIVAGSIPNAIYLDVGIKHTAEAIGEENLNLYIDTIAEFYIMADAENIIGLIYSGFSHMASMVKNPTFYARSHNLYHSLYNKNNIKYVP